MPKKSKRGGRRPGAGRKATRVILRTGDRVYFHPDALGTFSGGKVTVFGKDAFQVSFGSDRFSIEIARRRNGKLE